MSNKTIANEIVDIKTSPNDCYVIFKNGSEIRAISLGQGQTGNSARGWRFNLILVDEARIVKDSIIEEILIPMTKTKRENVLEIQTKIKDEVNEKGKAIFISSAFLKTCDLYKRFLTHYNGMTKGRK